MSGRRESAGLAATVMGAWPGMTESQIGAWWKLATLPIAGLPWPTAFAPDLP